MTNLSSLPKIVKKSKKRVGRGLASGKGRKSGRGTKRHQKAREAIPIHFEGGQGRMVKKFPLLRGKGRNKPIRPKPVVIPVRKLNIFKDGEVIDEASLVKRGVIKEKDLKFGVKILSDGQLKKRVIVKVPMSKRVREMVENLNKK